jgi:hypothetical protein
MSIFLLYGLLISLLLYKSDTKAAEAEKEKLLKITHISNLESALKTDKLQLVP